MWFASIYIFIFLIMWVTLLVCAAFAWGGAAYVLRAHMLWRFQCPHLYWAKLCIRDFNDDTWYLNKSGYGSLPIAILVHSLVLFIAQ